MQEPLLNNSHNVFTLFENNPRRKKESILLQSQDNPITAEDNYPIMQEIKAHQNYSWISNDKELQKKHGPLLFYKENN